MMKVIVIIGSIARSELLSSMAKCSVPHRTWLPTPAIILLFTYECDDMAHAPDILPLPTYNILGTRFSIILPYSDDWCLVHTTDKNKTRLSWLDMSCPCRLCEQRTGDKPILSATENFETVLSSLKKRWGLLKTVLTCRQFCSTTDKTR